MEKRSSALRYRVLLSITILMFIIFAAASLAFLFIPEMPRRNPRESASVTAWGMLVVASMWALSAWFLLKRVARRVDKHENGVDVTLRGETFFLRIDDILDVYQPTLLRVPFSRVTFDQHDGKGSRTFWIVEGELDQFPLRNKSY